MDVTVFDVILIGIRSWLLLAAGLGILYLSIVILNKLTGKKKENDSE